MAVRTIALGGTDWTDEEVLTHTDLNDTIDAMSSKVKTLSAFWLNSDLYEVYDNFNSYPTAAFTTNSLWTITGTASIVESTNAGGDTKEFYAISGAGATTKLLTENRHTFVRMYTGTQSRRADASAAVVCRFGNTGDYFSLNSQSAAGQPFAWALSCIYVINTADGAYDLYIGGKKVASYSGVSAANAQLDILSITTGFAEAYWYMDDVRQSAEDVS